MQDCFIYFATNWQLASSSSHSALWIQLVHIPQVHVLCRHIAVVRLLLVGTITPLQIVTVG